MSKAISVANVNLMPYAYVKTIYGKTRDLHTLFSIYKKLALHMIRQGWHSNEANKCQNIPVYFPVYFPKSQYEIRLFTRMRFTKKYRIQNKNAKWRPYLKWKTKHRATVPISKRLSYILKFIFECKVHTRYISRYIFPLIAD